MTALFPTPVGRTACAGSSDVAKWPATASIAPI